MEDQIVNYVWNLKNKVGQEKPFRFDAWPNKIFYSLDRSASGTWGFTNNCLDITVTKHKSPEVMGQQIKFCWYAQESMFKTEAEKKDGFLTVAKRPGYAFTGPIPRGAIGPGLRTYLKSYLWDFSKWLVDYPLIMETDTTFRSTDGSFSGTYLVNANGCLDVTLLAGSDGVVGQAQKGCWSDVDQCFNFPGPNCLRPYRALTQAAAGGTGASAFGGGIQISKPDAGISKSGRPCMWLQYGSLKFYTSTMNEPSETLDNGQKYKITAMWDDEKGYTVDSTSYEKVKVFWDDEPKKNAPPPANTAGQLAPGGHVEKNGRPKVLRSCSDESLVLDCSLPYYKKGSECFFWKAKSGYDYDTVRPWNMFHGKDFEGSRGFTISHTPKGGEKFLSLDGNKLVMSNDTLLHLYFDHDLMFAYNPQSFQYPSFKPYNIHDPKLLRDRVLWKTNNMGGIIGGVIGGGSGLIMFICCMVMMYKRKKARENEVSIIRVPSQTIGMDMSMPQDIS